ncbi:MAG: hypothetical protein BWY24_00334 [Microgenomates group bacterium ADurb.Bin219]|nr:MAG: hypothetical protein BWY24_00334 [Microgenomates group bacterium ADurb.Bin219]
MSGTEIIYQQAPCRPDGVISSDGQQETKEGACRCPANPKGCCVDGIGRILPLRLKKGEEKRKR